MAVRCAPDCEKLRSQRQNRPAATTFKCKGGNVEHDWKKLLDEHGSVLLMYARQWAGSHADAEEAVQQGFVRFWKSRHRDAENPLPLLFTMVKRSAIDQARSRSRRTERERRAEAERGERVSYFESTLESDERRRSIEAALEQLPDEQREVLVMKIWGDLTFRAIAESLEIPQNTAASRYRYALNTLRGILDGEQPA